jgi:Zn-finger protein
MCLFKINPAIFVPPHGHKQKAAVDNLFCYCGFTFYPLLCVTTLSSLQQKYARILQYDQSQSKWVHLQNVLHSVV